MSKRSAKSRNSQSQKKNDDFIFDGMTTAILVDGGFYRQRTNANRLTPEEASDALENYCKRHLFEIINGQKVCHDLYRIFYYDCIPMSKVMTHPLTKETVDLSKSDVYSWSMEFFERLKEKRKFALRFGKLSETQAKYVLKDNALKSLCKKEIEFSDIQKNDFVLDVDQKGVDMKIGLDIASLAYKNQVDQIVLISGDSDFVSAAKLARREGIDFVLDPLGATVKPDLHEHIDGLRSVDSKFENKSHIPNKTKATKSAKDTSSVTPPTTKTSTDKNASNTSTKDDNSTESVQVKSVSTPKSSSRPKKKRKPKNKAVA